MLKILLVEDDPNWQQAISQLLSLEPGYRLVGVADNYDDALILAELHQPDMVLLDWQIKPDKNGAIKDGIATGHALMEKKLSPERFVVISGSPAADIPEHPFLFVPKSRLATELLGTLNGIGDHVKSL